MTVSRAILICISGAYLVLLAMLVVSGPVIHPDSSGYMDNSFLRAPILPLIIDGFEFILGKELALTGTIFFQLAVCFCGIAYCSLATKKLFSLSSNSTHLVAIILAAPLLKFGTSILAEPLGYGLNAFFMGLLFSHITTGKYRHLGCMACVAAIEFLLRPQFFYVFVFLILYTGFLFIRKRKAAHLLIAVCITCLWVGMTFVRSGYNAYHHGHFGQYSAIGEHLLATQLYISPPSDLDLFSNPDDSAFMARLYSRIDAERLSIRNWDYTKSHYNKSITRIYFGHILPVYSELFQAQGAEGLIERDNHCKTLGVTLLKANFKSYVKLLFLKLYYGPFNFLLLYSVLAILSIAWCFRTQTPQGTAYLAVSTLTLFNYGMLIPFALIVKRYTLFTDIFQILLTGLCGLWLLERMPRTQEHSRLE